MEKQNELFPEELREAPDVGFPPRNPPSIARNARREANAEARRLAYEDTLRNAVVHAKLQKLARNLKRG